MITTFKSTIQFLVWARFLQMLVCNQENQKHIRGLIGLLTICMILSPVHKNISMGIKELIEKEMSIQEEKNNKITSDFWKNCEEMIEEEMDGEDWKEHEEKRLQSENGNKLSNEAELNVSKIKIQVR